MLLVGEKVETAYEQSNHVVFPIDEPRFYVLFANISYFEVDEVFWNKVQVGHEYYLVPMGKGDY